MSACYYCDRCDAPAESSVWIRVGQLGHHQAQIGDHMQREDLCRDCLAVALGKEEPKQ